MNPRVVIFMTTPCAADIPQTTHPLACLLPFGYATFAERVLQSCAAAGLKHLDVVASDYPEALRALLGDGSAWGLRLTWHLAKDSSTPYQVLHHLGLAANTQVVVGHAHQWISEQVVSKLLARPGVAMQIDPAVVWTGWYSDAARVVCARILHEDPAALRRRVAALASPCVLARPGEFAQADSAAALLQTQQLALSDNGIADVPASWRRMPWGAMSPDASVAASATLVGPVLLGPGCVVSAGAQVGPEVVLCRDVLVCGGAQISESVVLANTYVGGQVSLHQTVAQGDVVHNLKWNVRTVLPAQDALLTSLAPCRSQQTPLVSKILAAVLALWTSPLVCLLALGQWLRGQSVGWRTCQVVKGRHVATDALQTVAIRQTHPGGWLARSVGLYGAVLDVAQGRRCWLGLRPRSSSEWYALGRDWQTLFGQSMLGVFHAPAWCDASATPDTEAMAAADAFLAVQPRWRGRMRLIQHGLDFG